MLSVFFQRLLDRKTKLTTEGDGGNFSCGLCHGTSGNDQGAGETCQPGRSAPSGARRAGGARAFMEPLCLSALSLSFGPSSRCSWTRVGFSVRRQVSKLISREDKRKVFRLLLYTSISPMYLFLCRLPAQSEGLDTCLWRVQVCVCV